MEAVSGRSFTTFPGDRSTVSKLLPVFGKVPLVNITPQTIKAYLDTRDDLTKTTINRYRGTISMIFQEAIRNGKATANPARLVRLHREDNSRSGSLPSRRSSHPRNHPRTLPHP